MAEQVLGKGVLPDGTRIEFTLDGLATSNQIDKLIKLSAEMIKTWDKDNKAAQDTLDKLAGVLKDNDKSLGDFKDSIDDTGLSLDNLKKNSKKVKELFSDLGSGRFTDIFKTMPHLSTQLAGSVGMVVGSFVGYADNLKDSLQRGISGNIFDVAIAAKSAGVSLGDFNKAIAATDGSFAALGMGATDGAKQFGVLIGSVRDATKSVGNLGMSNDQMAVFTAQQVKVAVAQGFKGKQAQDVVTKNTKMLGEELDNLANRTGKSVLDLTQAAAKLAQDPIVANFVRGAKEGGKEISAAAQAFAASLKGVFGEQGDQIAKDALQSAMSGLPMVITQAGKNLVLASSGIYSEIERQAQAAARGEKVTEADRARLRDMIIQEVKARKTELNQFAMLGGPVGESAKQMLAMANEAENYNTAEAAKRREQDKTAQEFNAAIREFQANIQALAVPILKLLNNIDWGAFVGVIGKAIGAFNFVVDGIGKFIDGIFNLIPGLESVHGVAGTLLGGLLGLGAVVVGGTAIFKALGATVGLISTQFKLMKLPMDALAASIKKLIANVEIAAAIRGGAGRAPSGKWGQAADIAGALGSEAGGLLSKRPGTMIGKLAKGVGIGSMIGIGADLASSAVGKDTTAGKALSVAGTAAGWGATGFMLGGPWGAIAGALAGGVLQGFQEFFGNKEDQSAKEQLQDQQASASERALKDTQTTLEQNRQMLAELRAIREETGYGNQINARGVSYAESSERKLSNMQFNNA